MFCSTRQLIAAAAPATSAMPSVPKSTGPAGGIPGTARNMPMTAVNTISDTTRVFVRAKNWRARVSEIARVVIGQGSEAFACERAFYRSGLPFPRAPARRRAPERSADRRCAQQPCEILRHRLDVGMRRPREHIVAEWIDEVDAGSAFRQIRDRCRGDAGNGEVGLLGELVCRWRHIVDNEPDAPHAIALRVLDRSRLP